MTLDEKLDHFYSSVIDSATQQNIEIVEEYKKTLKKNYNERQEAAHRRAETNYQNAKGNIHRERNRQLSARSMEIKRQIMEKTAEISEQIFIQVRKRLDEYMKTPEYEELLYTLIQKAVALSKGDTVVIYLNPSDAQKLSSLVERTGAALKVSDRDFIGGCRAVISSRSILIDYSFLTKLEENRNTFTLESV